MLEVRRWKTLLHKVTEAAQVVFFVVDLISTLFALLLIDTRRG
jgi:hypothetical protein